MLQTENKSVLLTVKTMKEIKYPDDVAKLITSWFRKETSK